MPKVPSQKLHWNRKHTAGDHKKFIERQSVLAKSLLKYLDDKQNILDIGCGVGNDAAYFAKHGHQVTGIDFSDVIISQNQERYRDMVNLKFRAHDITKLPMPYKSGSFDAIHAHLSLHYFDDRLTKALFKEVHRVLRPSGILSIACKGKGDFYYGKGKEIGTDIFLHKGHVRHFFTPEYLKECLANKFQQLSFKEIHVRDEGKPKHLLLCVAKKVANAGVT